jgi:hypothetical protein
LKSAIDSQIAVHVGVEYLRRKYSHVNVGRAEPAPTCSTVIGKVDPTTRFSAQYLNYMVLALNHVAVNEAGSNISSEVHGAFPGLETSFICIWRYITSREAD